MGMGSDQVMERSAVFEGAELPLVAGGVDDQPIPSFDQDGVTVGVTAAADEFYRAFGKIVHGNLQAINKMRLGHKAPRRKRNHENRVLCSPMKKGLQIWNYPPEIPLDPPEPVKKFKQREIGGSGMPGGGANSRRQNRRWFLRGRRGIYPPEAEARISFFLLEYGQIAGVARRKSGKCFTGIYLPPGFGGVNFPLRRATRKAFPSLRLNFFTAPLFQRGKFGTLYPNQTNSLSSLWKREDGRDFW